MYEIIGIEEVNYTSKKTGQLVNGRRLHLSYDLEGKANVEGIGVEAIFTTSDNAKHAKIGDKIDVYYNKYGNVQDIRILDK